MRNRTFLISMLAGGMLAMAGPVLAQGGGSGTNGAGETTGAAGVQPAPAQGLEQNPAATGQASSSPHGTKHKRSSSKPMNDAASGPAAVTNGATKGR
jgi:hypothetical protein